MLQTESEDALAEGKNYENRKTEWPTVLTFTGTIGSMVSHGIMDAQRQDRVYLEDNLKGIASKGRNTWVLPGYTVATWHQTSQVSRFKLLH